MANPITGTQSSPTPNKIGNFFRDVGSFVLSKKILIWTGMGVATALLFSATPLQRKRGALYGMVAIPVGGLLIPLAVKKNGPMATNK